MHKGCDSPTESYRLIASRAQKDGYRISDSRRNIADDKFWQLIEKTFWGHITEAMERGVDHKAEIAEEKVKSTVPFDSPPCLACAGVPSPIDPLYLLSMHG